MLTEVDAAVVERVAQAMEVSAADPQHGEMVVRYPDDLGLKVGARVLEVGLRHGRDQPHRRRPARGARGLRRRPFPDPARDRPAAQRGVREPVVPRGRRAPAPAGERAFRRGRPAPRALPRARARADPRRGVPRAGAGRPAGRVRRRLRVTLARGDVDPLQACADAFRLAYITDPWLMRRLSALATGCGFAPERLRGHGYARVQHPEYMLSIADRGADALAPAGTIGPELAAGLKAEARRRVATNEFSGHVAYVSLTARNRDLGDTDREPWVLCGGEVTERDVLKARSSVVAGWLPGWAREEEDEPRDTTA